MRTLLISDLHLGSALERDVLRRPEALARLTGAAARADRLVLLGDVLELLEGRPDSAVAAAEPVLRRLAAALPSGAHVVVVPGNHDHALVRQWLGARLAAGDRLRPSMRVPVGASPLLTELVGWLRAGGATSVEVRYPGVWVADRVWATHGHHLDRLLGAALLGRLREPAGAPRAHVGDFERAPGADAGAIQELLAAAVPDALGDGVGAVLGGARRGLLSALPALAAVPGLREAASLAALVMDQGVHRRGAIPAMAEVTRRLRVPADVVVFGHIHRRGPLAGDAPGLWRPDPDGPRLVNAGSWVFDGALVGPPREGVPRPYRPGGAVWVEPGREPETVDLLADVPDAVLRGRL